MRKRSTVTAKCIHYNVELLGFNVHTGKVKEINGFFSNGKKQGKKGKERREAGQR